MMRQFKFNFKTFLVPISLVVIAAFFRLVPHPPNFTPLTAIALFGGTVFNRRWIAFLVPFLAMFLSDIIIGFHSTIWAVYFSFGLIVLIGTFLKSRFSFKNLILATFVSSFLFYLITNFAVWLTSGFYSHNFEGLIQCYILGLPFYRTTTIEFFVYSLVGDFVFTLSIFGAYKLAEKILVLER